METLEQQERGDLQEALRVAIEALLRAYAAATSRLEPDQLAEVRRRVAANTGKLALFVSSDGHQAHAELALVGADAGSVFTAALLTLDGPVAVAAAPAGDAQVVNRAAMN